MGLARLSNKDRVKWGWNSEQRAGKCRARWIYLDSCNSPFSSINPAWCPLCYNSQGVCIYTATIAGTNCHKVKDLFFFVIKMSCLSLYKRNMMMHKTDTWHKLYQIQSWNIARLKPQPYNWICLARKAPCSVQLWYQRFPLQSTLPHPPTLPKTSVLNIRKHSFILICLIHEFTNVKADGL